MTDKPRSRPQGGYSSERMQARRRAVMAATRNLIAESGLDGFSMRELARRAGVSAATLFNIYSSRENLVSQAVVDAFNAPMPDGGTDRPDNLRELRAYIEWTAGEIISLGAYVDVIVATFFSRGASNPIRDILRRESEAPYIHFLEKLRTSDPEGMLDPHFTAKLIATHLFSSMHAWRAGELSDAELPGALERGIIVIILGCMARPSTLADLLGG